jgi:hypothetical protein
MTTIATAISYAAPTPRVRTPRSIVVGRVMSGIISALLIADGAFKLFPSRAMIDASAQLGYSVDVMPAIGITLLACVALYLIPATSVFGALLLTGYLGGAIATHVRVGNPLFSHILFPTYVATIVWGGLYLRNARLRALVAINRQG